MTPNKMLEDLIKVVVATANSIGFVVVALVQHIQPYLNALAALVAIVSGIYAIAVSRAALRRHREKDEKEGGK